MSGQARPAREPEWWWAEDQARRKAESKRENDAVKAFGDCTGLYYGVGSPGDRQAEPA